MKQRELETWLLSGGRDWYVSWVSEQTTRPQLEGLAERLGTSYKKLLRALRNAMYTEQGLYEKKIKP